MQHLLRSAEPCTPGTLFLWNPRTPAVCASFSVAQARVYMRAIKEPSGTERNCARLRLFAICVSQAEVVSLRSALADLKEKKAKCEERCKELKVYGARVRAERSEGQQQLKEAQNVRVAELQRQHEHATAMMNRCMPPRISPCVAVLFCSVLCCASPFYPALRCPVLH